MKPQPNPGAFDWTSTLTAGAPPDSAPPAPANGAARSPLAAFQTHAEDTLYEKRRRAVVCELAQKAHDDLPAAYHGAAAAILHRIAQEPGHDFAADEALHAITEFLPAPAPVPPALMRAARSFAQIDARVVAPQSGTLAVVDAADLIDTEPPAPDQILAGIFDAGDKVPIIGASKTRKTFFALQMAATLAAGRPDFLGLSVPRARRVLFVQAEVKPAHFHRRVRNMAAALGISAAEITDRLAIFNARGVALDFRKIAETALAHGAEVIILDPLYKLTKGDENSAEDMKPTLAKFDRLAEETGAAVLYVHHTAKGSPGDRDTRDRGAGSGVIARDFDAAFFVTEHRDCDDTGGLFVLRFVLRNYATPPPTALRFAAGRFQVAEDVAPVERTSQNRGKAGRPAPTTDDALAVFDGGPLRGAEAVRRLQACGFTKDGALSVRDRLRDSGKLEEYTPPTFPRRTFYGTPAQIAAMKKKVQEPGLEGLK